MSNWCSVFFAGTDDTSGVVTLRNFINDCKPHCSKEARAARRKCVAEIPHHSTSLSPPPTPPSLASLPVSATVVPSTPAPSPPKPVKRIVSLYPPPPLAPKTPTPQMHFTPQRATVDKPKPTSLRQSAQLPQTKSSAVTNASVPEKPASPQQSDQPPLEASQTPQSAAQSPHVSAHSSQVSEQSPRVSEQSSQTSAQASQLSAQSASSPELLQTSTLSPRSTPPLTKSSSTSTLSRKIAKANKKQRPSSPILTHTSLLQRTLSHTQLTQLQLESSQINKSLPHTSSNIFIGEFQLLEGALLVLSSLLTTNVGTKAIASESTILQSLFSLLETHDQPLPNIVLEILCEFSRFFPEKLEQELSSLPDTKDYQPLTKFLYAVDSSACAKVLSLSTLNRVIVRKEDLKERLFARYNLWKLLGPLMATLSSSVAPPIKEEEDIEIALQLEQFESCMNEEISSFYSHQRSEKVIDMREDKSQTQSTLNIDMRCPEVPVRNIILPFSEYDTVASLLQRIVLVVGMAPELASTYALACYNASECVFFDETKLMASYQSDFGTGQLSCLLVQTPRQIPISVPELPEGQYFCELQTTCHEALVKIISLIGMESSPEDYGLFAQPTDTTKKGVWIPETSTVSEYAKNENEVKVQSKVLFMCRPRYFTVQIGEDTISECIDLTNPIRTVSRDIMNNLCGSLTLAEEYSMIASLPGKQIPLEDQKNLKFYCLPGEARLLLVPRTRKMTVLLPDGEKMKDVHLTHSSADFLKEICKEYHLTTQNFIVQKITNDGKTVTLVPWTALKQQGVRLGDKLALKEISNITNAPTGTETSADGNIWDPSVTLEILPEFSLDSSKTFRPATLNTLVRILTNEGQADNHFIKTFLTTYLSFTTSEILLQKLRERFEVPTHIPEQQRAQIQWRVCAVLNYWVDMQWETSTSALDGIFDFVNKLPQGQLAPMVKRLQNSILSKRMKPHREYHFLEPPPAPLINASSLPCTWTEINPVEIARQLTITTFNFYSGIKPTEFFRLAWSKPELRHLSPNIVELTNLFNKITNWVTHSIVSTPKIRDRINVFHRHIMTALKLKELSNFHLLMAYISAMNSAPVQRLKWTKSKLPKTAKQTLLDLEELTNIAGSYRNLRTTISSCTPPCIPYIGTYLIDLTFIEEGNPDTVDGLINFEKRKLIFKAIDVVQQYQEVGYNLSPVPGVVPDDPLVSEQQMFNLSLQVEPRGASLKDVT
ncbi:Ras guanine nucleotide exchange factor [Pelomyxa schiedti]|nr:Ras guanine nucleotide exchange factor [Pelomyxa schiedti]